MQSSWKLVCVCVCIEIGGGTKLSFLEAASWTWRGANDQKVWRISEVISHLIDLFFLNTILSPALHSGLFLLQLLSGQQPAHKTQEPLSFALKLTLRHSCFLLP